MEIAGRLQDALRIKLKTGKDDMMEIDIQTGDDVENDMDWCMVESKEHAYLADLMERLEIGFGKNTNIEMKEIDNLNEEMEHTILDNILLEWEQEEDDDMEEGMSGGGLVWRWGLEIM